MTYDAGEAFIRFSGNFDGMIEQATAEGRRAGEAYQRAFEAQLRRTNQPSIRPDVDTTRANAEIEALRRQLAELGRTGRVRVDVNAGGTSAQLATITAATNRLSDAQARLSAARANLDQVSRKEGVTEAELAAATARVTRAERDQELATLRLAATQEALAASQQRAAASQQRAADQAARTAQRSAAAEERAAATRARADQRAADQAARAEEAQNKSRLGSLSLASGLIALAPAAIPLIGAAVAGGAALAAMGASGILAIKGIKTEMDSGTKTGVQYTATINTGKTALADLEKTAARNLLAGFQSSVTKLNGELPRFNAVIGTSAKSLGDVGSHLVGGLVGGFTTFDPLITKVEAKIVSLSAKFETWATGSGGAKFAQALSDDFDQVVPVIGHVVTSVGRLVAAFAPAGGVILHEIDAVSSAINHIPVGVLQTLATGFVAIKTASLVSGGLGALSKSLTGTAESAGLLGGRLGTVGVILSRFTPYAAAAVGLHFAFQAADKATADWATSTSTLQYAAHETFKAMDQLFSLNFSGLGKTLFGDSDDKARTFAINIDKGIKEITVSGQAAKDGWNAYTGAVIKNGTVVYSTLDTVTGKYDNLTLQQQRALEQQRIFASGSAKLNEQLRQYQTTNRGQTVTTAGPAYLQEASALTKVNDANLKAITTGKVVAETYHSVKISEEAVVGVMEKYHLSAAAALGFLEAQVDVYNKGATAAKNYAARAELVNNAVSGAQAKYKLTADQVGLYAQALGITGVQLANGTVTAGQFNEAIGRTARAVSNGDVSLQTWIAAIAQFNSGTDTAASRGQLLAAAMVALQGDTLGYANTMVGAATANQKLVTDFNATTKGVVNLKTGFIDYHNAGAAPVLGDLQQLQTAAMNAAAATYQHEKATLGAKQATKDAAAVFRNDTYGALVDQAKQLGITDGQAKKLADRYFHWPKNAKTLLGTLGQDKVANTLGGILRQLQILNGLRPKPVIDVDTSPGDSALNRFEARLNALAGRHVAATVNTNTGAAAGPGSARGSRSWTRDGKLPPGVSTVGEEGFEAAITDRFGRTEILSHAQTVAMGIRPGRVQGFAGGTGPGESGGFSGVTPKVGTGPNADPAATAATKAASKAAEELKQKLQAATQAERSFLDAVGLTVNPIRSAEHAMLGAAKAAGASAKEIAGLERMADRLANKSKQLNKVEAQLGTRPTAPTAYEKLATQQQLYKDLKSSIVDAIKGGFTLSSAGVRSSAYSDSVSQGVLGAFSLSSVDPANDPAATAKTTPIRGLGGASVSTTQPVLTAGFILSTLKKTEADAHRFVDLLKKLASEGLPQGLLDQLAAAGPSALAQAEALRAATPKQLAAIKSTYTALTSDSKALVKPAVTFGSIYGEARKAAQDARKLASGLRKLAAGGLDPALVAQLAQAGVAALPQVEALLDATPAQLAALDRQEHSLAHTGSSLGATLGTDLYGAGIQAAQGIIDGLRAKEKDLKKQMTHLADIMVKQLKKDLGIASPSKVGISIGQNLGGSVGSSAVHGVRQHIPNMTAAVGELANARYAVTDIANGTAQKFGGAPLISFGGITQMPNEDGAALAERVASRAMFALASR